MSGINQLESLRVFKAVVEAGSFSAAAKRLNLSAARVSKSIEGLEKELGSVLLNRSTRYMQITSSGESCYNQALVMINQWQALQQASCVEHNRAKGKLHISVPTSLALTKLAPILDQFMTAYPQIFLDIQLSNEQVNLVEQQYDLVLRLTPKMPDSALLCRKITSYQFIACAAPAYLAQHGEPVQPADLTHHACLVYHRLGGDKKWRFNQGKKAYSVVLEPRIRSNDSMLLHSALLAGHGIALIPDFIVAQDLADGRLHPLLQNYTTSRLNLYSLRANERMTSHRLRLLLDYLNQALGAT